jgi:hypothetical protein
VEILGNLIGLGKDLGLRFRAATLLPAIMVGLILLVLVLGGAPLQSPNLGTFLDTVQKVSRSIGGIAGILLVLFFYLLTIAVVLEPLQASLVHLLEGQWGMSAISIALRGWLIVRHRRRYEALADVAANVENRHIRAYAEEKLYLRYPNADRIEPTSLGNILRACEDRVTRRYGLATTAVWPRLYTLLPPELRERIDGQSEQIDLAARFCLAFLASAILSFGFLLGYGLWLLVPLVLLILGWLSYRAAIAAAVYYGTMLETAFDLYRFQLLEALRVPLPDSRSAEHQLNDDVSRLFMGDSTVDMAYIAMDKTDDRPKDPDSSPKSRAPLRRLARWLS